MSSETRWIVAVIVAALCSPASADSFEALSARPWTSRAPAGREGGPRPAAERVVVRAGARAWDATDDKVFRHALLEAAKRGEPAILDLGEAFQVLGKRKTPAEAYRNGDAWFFIGDITDAWARDEWKLFYNVTRRMLRNGYRVVTHPFPKVRDVRAAVQDPRTSVIIWSGHGTEEGAVSTQDAPLPRDVFVAGAGPRLRYLVISACNGEKVVRRYPMPEGVEVKHWTGPTDTPDLFAFLNSDKFPPARR